MELDTGQGDLAAAAAVLEDLKSTSPTDPEVLYAAYRVYTDLAQQSVLALTLAAPNSAQMHQAMAHELIREGKNDAAVVNLRAALKADPDLPEGHYELAEVLHASVQPAQKAEAEQQYLLALEQNPKDAAALTRLGDIAAEKGDPNGAIARYKQALALRPGDTDASIGLAHEYTESGNPEAALPLLLAVMKADPTNELAHFRLSAVYRRLHRPEDAKHEVAEYQRLKTMHDKLHDLYQTMRLNTPQTNDAKE